MSCSWCAMKSWPGLHIKIGVEPKWDEDNVDDRGGNEKGDANNTRVAMSSER